MRLSRTQHIGIILSIIIFFTAKFMMERIHLRAQQIAENDMYVETGNRHWVYAIIVTVVFIIFYTLVSKEFNRIEDEHEEAEENAD